MQPLSIDKIRQCARGVVDVIEENGGICFRRFPPEVLDYYHSCGEGRAIRADCAAGVVLEFQTDARCLSLEADVPAGARSFGYADLYVGGRFLDAPGETPSTGRIERKVELPETEDRTQTVELHLPHCRTMTLRSLALSDGAAFHSAADRQTWLAIGDSITQGMNGLHPSLIYPSVAGRSLGLPVHNAGVGGAVFDAETLRQPLVDSPQLITVAYGINDFNGGADASAAGPYLDRLLALYPDVPVAILEPTWSPGEGFDLDPRPNAAGITLQQYRFQLREIVADFEGMCCLRAADLLPPVPEFVPDGVHPNTVGHQVMGANLEKLLLEDSTGIVPF
jgi:lysophospholipase L1-like esterase